MSGNVSNQHGRHPDRVSPQNELVHRDWEWLIRTENTNEYMRDAIYRLVEDDDVLIGFWWKHGGAEAFWTRVRSIEYRAASSDINELEKIVAVCLVVDCPHRTPINEGRLLRVGFWNILSVMRPDQTITPTVSERWFHQHGYTTKDQHLVVRRAAIDVAISPYRDRPKRK